MDTWLPGGPHTRRTFVVVVLLSCVTLICLRFFALPPLFGYRAPEPSAALDETMGNVIATALAGTGLALVLLWLFPAPRRPAIVESLPPNEIGDRLESAIPDTSSWWFDGSTGRYQRAKTLPEMARHARKDGMSREVTLVILDPRDAELCQRYADYRGGVEGKAWSVDDVRRDLYATMLAAYHHSQTAPLTVTLAVKQTMSILRYDLSDSQLVITKEGRTDPAIFCPAESFYYKAYLEQLRWSLKQAHMLELTTIVPVKGSQRETARAILRGLGVYTSTLDSDEIADEVAVRASSKEQPYA
jgi:hypothetical protein